MHTWVLKEARSPERGLVYPVLNLDGSVSFRAFDDSDGSWWFFSGRAGWVPNDSFTHWLPHEALPPKPADGSWLDRFCDRLAALVSERRG